MEQLKNIFDRKKSLINLNDLKLTKVEELDWIAKKLEKNLQINFINWGKNQSFIDENRAIKSRIQAKLVSNILNDKNNELIIDLSEFDIDIDFLSKLLNSMMEKPTRVGQVILSKQKQALFEDSNCWKQILWIVSKNNLNFRRYPSDAVHFMLACSCRHSYNNDLWSNLEQSKWKIENELKIPNHEYHSILFRNESTRNFVLAFRGLTFDFKECFSKNSQNLEFLTRLRQKLTIHCYYAYLHAQASFEKSKKLNFWLSFTGQAFGAWLAELSVLHFYRERGTSRVRAVTFDSPGSGEMFYQLDDALDFNELLDITTYLSCPNLVNTSSPDHKSIYDDEYADYTKPPQHLGAVYFINDIYIDKSNLVIILFLF